MMTKIKRYLTYFVVCTFPIMSIINITPSLIFNISLADIFVFLTGVVWIIDIKSFRIKKNIPFLWYFLLYITVMLLSNIYNMISGVKSSGVNGILSETVKIVISAAFAFISYNSVKEDKAEMGKIILAWIAGLYIFIAYGLYAQIGSYIGLQPWTFNNVVSGDRSRFLGTLTDANAAALYLSISFFIVIIGKKIFFKGFKQRIFFNITNFLTVICICLTFSRGGLAGFLCSLFIFFVFNIKAYIKFIYAAPALLCVVLTILVIDTGLLNNNISSRFTSRMKDAVSENGMLRVRLNLSISSVKMGLDHPIIGVGRGNFPLNSKPYIEQQGVDYDWEGFNYENMVPHNTIVGIFAELGFIGSFVFITLFALMFVRTIKSGRFDKSFKIIIFSMWTGILIQSLVISLENARVLWIVTGLGIGFLDRDVAFKCEPEEIHGFGLKVGTCISSASLVLCLLLYAYVGPRYTDGDIDITHTVLTIPYISEQSGRHTLRYFVQTSQSEGDSAQMEVSIKKAVMDEELDVVRYTTIHGYANLYFDAVAEESYVFEFAGGSQSSVSDVKIISEDGRKIVLAGRYPLLPGKIYEFFRDRGYLSGKKNDTIVHGKFVKSGLLDKSDYVVFGDKIRYKGVDIIRQDDGVTRFDFIFDCMGEMDKNYIMWMHLNVDDINTIDEGMRSWGYINCDHLLDVTTDTWEVGREYIHSYYKEMKDGYYYLSFGFWIPSEGESSGARLFSEDGNAGVSAGWFEIFSDIS